MNDNLFYNSLLLLILNYSLLQKKRLFQQVLINNYRKIVGIHLLLDRG